MKTASTNKKIREIIQSVKQGLIIPRPEFQRRLVWSRDDKNLFLDTILRGYPFPEVHLADGDVNLETGEGTQLLVDGLQRVSTIIQYFEADTALQLTTVLPYKDLEKDQKTAFLHYDVAVRDLGSVSRDGLVEIFKRLNATKYSLLDIEVNNAVYGGALKCFAEKLSEDKFFEDHRVFNAQDLKRMGDLRFALTIVITMIAGYFNRDDGFEAVLSRYNDDFPLEAEMARRLRSAIDFIDECGFGSGARVWRKADLLTLMIELDHHFEEGKPAPDGMVVERLGDFYDAVDAAQFDLKGIASVYYKAALQASNDRLNRVRRGIVVSGILDGDSDEAIFSQNFG